MQPCVLVTQNSCRALCQAQAASPAHAELALSQRAVRSDSPCWLHAHWANGPGSQSVQAFLVQSYTKGLLHVCLAASVRSEQHTPRPPVLAKPSMRVKAPYHYKRSEQQHIFLREGHQDPTGIQPRARIGLSAQVWVLLVCVLVWFLLVPPPDAGRARCIPMKA